MVDQDKAKKDDDDAGEEHEEQKSSEAVAPPLPPRLLVHPSVLATFWINVADNAAMYTLQQWAAVWFTERALPLHPHPPPVHQRFWLAAVAHRPRGVGHACGGLPRRRERRERRGAVHLRGGGGPTPAQGLLAAHHPADRRGVSRTIVAGTWVAFFQECQQ